MNGKSGEGAPINFRISLRDGIEGPDRKECNDQSDYFPTTTAAAAAAEEVARSSCLPGKANHATVTKASGSLFAPFCKTSALRYAPCRI